MSPTIQMDEFKKQIELSGTRKCYSVAFTLRSGSTLFSNLVSRLNIGDPTEYFQYPYRNSFYFQDFAEDGITDQLKKLVAAYTKNGIFGSKIAHDHRAHLEGKLKDVFPNFEKIDDVFPHHSWFFIRRRDLINQAISLYIATITDQWHLPVGDSLRRDSEIPYDFYGILSNLTTICVGNTNWEVYFHKHNISPLVVYYEDFVADRNKYIKSIAEVLQVEVKEVGAPLEELTQLRRISSEAKDLYETMKARFEEDFLNLGSEKLSEVLAPQAARWDAFFRLREWNDS